MRRLGWVLSVAAVLVLAVAAGVLVTEPDARWRPARACTYSESDMQHPGWCWGKDATTAEFSAWFVPSPPPERPVVP